VASSKSRQRELARAKYHRQMARKASAERRRRQVLAATGVVLAVALVVVGGLWVGGAFKGNKKPSASDVCLWNPVASGNPDIKDVGQPPTSGVPISGTRPMNITLPEGLITVELDLTHAPCTAASFAYLASKNFFDNTKCHRFLTQGVYVLQCGDPSGKGDGGPGYTYADENVPAPTPPTAVPSATPSGSAAPSTTVVYTKGTVAMANGGPDSNSSQFFIVYKDSVFPANYVIAGKVISGLEVVDKLAAQGTEDNGSGEPSKPKKDIVIQSLTVGEVQTPGPVPTTPVPTTTAPSATPTSTAPKS
jgi:peptidyl-prolyl cis-trans isomerase B (cyclophilin B)